MDRKKELEMLIEHLSKKLASTCISNTLQEFKRFKEFQSSLNDLEALHLELNKLK